MERVQKDYEHQIDVILLTHNKLENTRRCVEALYENTHVPFRLTVIDDSTDETPEYFFQLNKAKYIRPNVKIKSANHAINLGMKVTQSDPFIFLTNSTFVAPNWLDKALEIMEDPKVGVVGFKMVSPKTGEIFPSVGFRARDSYRPDKYDSILDVMVVGWAAVLLRREAVFGLDEDYYIGFRGVDDTDNCLEIKRRGWKVIHNGMGTIYHHPTSSASGTELGRIETEENLRRFAIKWKPLVTAVSQKEVYHSS